MATILIVDDEPSVMAVVSTVLKRDGHEILQAISARDAMRTASSFSNPIDLLITNHVLHDGRGREVAEYLLKTRPALKVLHVSGHPRAELESDHSLTPGAAFLQKPFRPHQLSAKVAELLR